MRRSCPIGALIVVVTASVSESQTADAPLPVVVMAPPADTTAFLHLRQSARIPGVYLRELGVEGVTSAAIDHRGRVFVADGTTGTVMAFDPMQVEKWRLLPVRGWHVSASLTGEVLVLDMAGRAIAVLSEHLELLHRVPLPDDFLPVAVHAWDGREYLVVGRSDDGGPAAIVVAPSGQVLLNLGPLLSGQGASGPAVGAATDATWLIASSQGDQILVVDRRTASARLCSRESRAGSQRSVGLVPLSADTILQTVRDLRQNDYATEIFTIECEFVRRRTLRIPLTLVGRSRDQFVAVLALNTPDVVTYSRDDQRP